MNDSGKKKTPSFARHPDTEILIVRLRNVPVGEVITYDALASAIQCDVRKGAACSRLHSARRIVQHEDAAVFGCVRSLGLKRLAAGEVVQQGPRDRKRIHRATGRALDRQETVDLATVGPDVRSASLTERCLFGAVRQATTPRVYKRLEVAVSSAGARLSLADTIAMFKDS